MRNNMEGRSLGFGKVNGYWGGKGRVIHANNYPVSEISREYWGFQKLHDSFLSKNLGKLGDLGPREKKRDFA